MYSSLPFSLHFQTACGPSGTDVKDNFFPLPLPNPSTSWYQRSACNRIGMYWGTKAAQIQWEVELGSEVGGAGCVPGAEPGGVALRGERWAEDGWHCPPFARDNSTHLHRHAALRESLNATHPRGTCHRTLSPPNPSCLLICFLEVLAPPEAPPDADHLSGEIPRHRASLSLGKRHGERRLLDCRTGKEGVCGTCYWNVRPTGDAEAGTGPRWRYQQTRVGASVSWCSPPPFPADARGTH